MKTLIFLFLIYKPQGVLKAFLRVLRLLILPYKKIDAIVPTSGTIVDIGCGDGGLANYLALRSNERIVRGIDISKNRITSAYRSIGKRKNVEFMFGDAVTTKQPKADCYLMVDVLHHIAFKNQEKLLHFLAKRLSNKSLLIIKEIDPSNRIPFLFGHIIEKILYPHEKIYARSKKDWEFLFKSLELSLRVIPGVFYFPDSTRIFIISSNKPTSNGFKSKVEV